MQAATDRRSHDDDRVPLDALIELSHAEGGEVLEADAVDVSSGGLSLRASFMPPVGARMQCRFSCPPHGDRVVADCEVVWSVLEGPQAGAFGVRFLALDTRSATLIRRLLEPENPHVREVLAQAPDDPPEAQAPASPRLASLHIEGLGAPIEADVQLDEQDHVLLTQELSFLRLGRGVRVEIEGARERLGRIASVKLEQTRDDTPALSLGVLIDAPLPEPVSAPRSAPPASAVEPSAPAEMPAATDTWPESPLFDPRAEPDRAASEPTAATPTAPAQQAPTLRSVGPEEGVGSEVAPTPEAAPSPSPAVETPSATVVQTAPAPPAPPSGEPDAGAVDEGQPSSSPRGLPALSELLSADAVQRLRDQLSAQLARARALAVERAPQVRDWLGALWSRLRQWLRSQSKRVEHFKRTQKKRRTTAPPPRARAKAADARRGQKSPAAATRSGGRGRLVLVGLLAFAGVAAAIYALAPRRSDESLVLHRPVQAAAQPEVAEPSRAPAPATDDTPEAEVAAAAQPAAPEAEDSTQEAGDALSFGAADVPHGRTYSLRMSGPIERIEGEELRGGFAVRVPGRLSLDRAAPIATSHPALSRSLILNQGDRAELTIEFAPGKQPAYRVEAKGNNLEITVERI